MLGALLFFCWTTRGSFTDWFAFLHFLYVCVCTCTGGASPAINGLCVCVCVFACSDDEHMLIQHYCQSLNQGSPLSQPRSPAQILISMETEEKGELERVLNDLEQENRSADSPAHLGSKELHLKDWNWTLSVVVQVSSSCRSNFNLKCTSTKKMYRSCKFIQVSLKIVLVICKGLGLTSLLFFCKISQSVCVLAILEIKSMN